MRKSAIIGDKPRHIAPGIKLPFRSLGANHVIVLANVDRLKVAVLRQTSCGEQSLAKIAVARFDHKKGEQTAQACANCFRRLSIDVLSVVNRLTQ
jgi:hypothetical protein